MVDEAIWKIMQERLGYSEQEMKKFRNSRNEKVLAATNEIRNKTIIFEVVKVENCNIGHKEGDQFIFSAKGTLLAHKGPKEICTFLLPAMSKLSWIVQERIYEELTPEPTFPHGQCEDVGLNCGGWGRVVIKTKVIDRSQL